MATATASITGSVRAKSPVSSTTAASEVSGARAAAANTAPMAVDRDYEILRIGLRTLLDHVGITAAAQAA